MSSDKFLEHIANQIERLDSKISKTDEKIGNIEVILARNTTSLEEHIKRTNILEQKLEPVETHVKHVEGIVKFTIWLATISGLYELGSWIWNKTH
jgi:hypothetical protein